MCVFSKKKGKRNRNTFCLKSGFVIELVFLNGYIKLSKICGKRTLKFTWSRTGLGNTELH